MFSTQFAFSIKCCPIADAHDVGIDAGTFLQAHTGCIRVPIMFFLMDKGTYCLIIWDSSTHVHRWSSQTTWFVYMENVWRANWPRDIFGPISTIKLFLYLFRKEFNIPEWDQVRLLSACFCRINVGEHNVDPRAYVTLCEQNGGLHRSFCPSLTWYICVNISQRLMIMSNWVQDRETMETLIV